MNKVKIKAIISSLLLIIFLIMTITGIGLYFSPSGQIANLTEWSFLGMDKYRLGMIHTNFSFAMVGLIVIHLFLNFKIFITETRVLFKK